MGVTICRFHFKHAVAELQDGNVKGTTTEVKHHDGFVIFTFLQAVRQSSRRWLIDDTLNFQAGNFTSVLGRLAL